MAPHANKSSSWEAKETGSYNFKISLERHYLKKIQISNNNYKMSCWKQEQLFVCDGKMTQCVRALVVQA